MKIILNKRQKEILDNLTIGENAEWVENPFTGVKCLLEPTAVALHDFIKGCEMLGNYKDFDQARYMFVEFWPDEYSKLLD